MDTASTGSLAISSIIAFFFPLPPPPPLLLPPPLPPPSASPTQSPPSTLEEEVARGSGDVGENSRSSKDLYQDEVANLTLVSSFCTLVCFSCTRISVANTLV